MDYDLRDSLRDGPGCGTAQIGGDATEVDPLSRSIVRHHLPQLLEEVLDEDNGRGDPFAEVIRGVQTIGWVVDTFRSSGDFFKGDLSGSPLVCPSATSLRPPWIIRECPRQQRPEPFRLALA